MKTPHLIQEVLHAYHVLDHQIRLFRLRSGLRCPPRCGSCCNSAQLEASTLECLPLAWKIFERRDEERIAAMIEAHHIGHDLRCVLYSPDSRARDQGRCSCYAYRPLLCRLFGYAARRNKMGQMEPCLCKVMLAASSQEKLAIPISHIDEMDPPVYQDCFLQIASINPAMGIRLLPINAALKEALDYVYWKFPKDRSPIRRKAA